VFWYGLLTVYTLLMCSVFLTFYDIIVLIFYFFLEPALMGLRPSGFQPPMTNKYCRKSLHILRLPFELLE